jgi:hypothetical protein
VGGIARARRTFTCFVLLECVGHWPVEGNHAASADAHADELSENARPERDDYREKPGPSPKAHQLSREGGFAARPLLTEARLGMATLVGGAGATASFDPWSRLAFGAGFGANEAGLQLAGFARFRPLVAISGRSARLHALTLELAYSTGPYDNSMLSVDGSGLTEPTWSYDRAGWLQPEVAYETRSFGGFNLRVGTGFAILLHDTGGECISAPCDVQRPSVLPSVSVALGYAWKFGP